MNSIQKELGQCKICFDDYTWDTSASDKSHLPVRSQRCSHTFCLGCIQRQQVAKAENEGRKGPPKWLVCMECRTKTAFCPQNPTWDLSICRTLELLADARREDQYGGKADKLGKRSSQAEVDQPPTVPIDETRRLQELDGGTSSMSSRSSSQGVAASRQSGTRAAASRCGAGDRRQSALDARWQQRLRELIEYKSTHGDCNVPAKFHENKQLSTWVRAQRAQYRLREQGKKSSLSDDRITDLEAIDFKWSLAPTTTTSDIRPPFINQVVERLQQNDPTLTEFASEGLSSSGLISDDAAVALANALRQNSTLVSFRLDDIGIGDKGIAALAEALQYNSSLSEINFGVWGVGKIGVAALAETLRRNSALLSLSLTFSDDSKAAELAKGLQHNSTLVSLHIRGSRCLNGGLRNKGAAALAEALRYNSSLTELDLSGNSIRDGGAAALAEALLYNRSLAKLDLHNNSIGDKGTIALAEALHHNSSLITLRLKINVISYKGAAAQAEAARYKLNTDSTGLENKGVVALAKALRYNCSLSELDLRYSFEAIRDEGATALAEALQHNSALTKLILTGSHISDKGAAALREALRHKSMSGRYCVDL